MLRRISVALCWFSIGCQSSQPTTPSSSASDKTPASPAASATPAPEPPKAPAYDGPPKTILVELYSSQGCDSCPEADAFIGEFPSQGWTRDKVIPLTFHVTYWDDLGWSDPFARHLFDQRQIGYAQNLPGARADDETTIRGPYTPQMVVDGRVHFSGALKDVARSEIERARMAPTLIDINIETSRTETAVAVDVRSSGTRAGKLDTDKTKVGLFAVLSQRAVQTEVPRGENAGRKLAEHWVVRDFKGPKLFRSAKETNDTHFDLTIPDNRPAEEFQVVVFAQDLGSMNVLAAASVPAAGHTPQRSAG